MIAAARAQFIAAGWQGTTISVVAKAALVSAETIYAVFGSKTALLVAVVERALRREAPNVRLLDQAGPQAVAAANNQREQLELFARDIACVLSNVAELMAVIRTAAVGDEALAALYRDLQDRRRRNLSFMVAALSKTGPLKMDEAAATAMLFRLASPDIFLLMMQVEGMTADGYAAWLATLESLLLP